jgi:signal transduction histidine kinase/ActR/RegA family two-component response regulator
MPTAQRRIPRRLLRYVLLSSVVFILLATGIIVCSDYFQAHENVHRSLELVKQGYLQTLSASLYKMDEEHLKLEMAGVIKLPGIRRVQVKDDLGSGYSVSFGEPDDHFSRIETFPLALPGGSPEQRLGTVTVSISLMPFYLGMLSRVLIVVALSAVLIILLSLMMLRVFNNQVTRRLEAMADFTGRLNLESIGEKLVLNRTNESPDELDRVGQSINSMLSRIEHEIAVRKRAEEERKGLEERLQRAEKMEALGTLAGGVAHDLNNVLGIVVGYSELLLDGLDESSSERSQAMEILRGGQRAAAIVQDLLTLARRGVTSKKVLNLNTIVMGCQKSPVFAKVLSVHPNTQIKTDFETDLLNVLGSSVHLEKSLINLVSNAVEAMPNGGTLTVKTANCYLDRPISGYDQVREGDYVVLSVSDTGEGIPASDLKRIFEPFYTKKVMGRSGTGLGLAVVWGMVKDHLGYINVESEEGKGTTFALYLPVSREDITAEEVAISASEYMGKGESILVVDDVIEQCNLAGIMLRKLNYTVQSVSSGEAAVEFLQSHKVDLVVLDMIMDPGMDGLDTYRIMLDIHPRQRAIIVSGFAETERVREAQSLGAGAYVKKPYVLEKLGLAVRKELDKVA